METRIPTELNSPLFGAILVGAELFCVAPAAAQVSSPGSSLVVTRGEGADDCPDAAALSEQVRRLSGAIAINAEPLSDAPSETWIQVAIVHNFGGYRAEINARGVHHGSRSLEDLGPSCASLADAITITIAIFLDPYAASPVLHAPPAAAALSARPAYPQSPTRVAQHVPRLSLELAGGAAFDVLEHTAPLVTGRVGWRSNGRWSIALGGALLFPDSLAVGDGAVDLGLSYGYVMGCARALGDALGVRLDWCAAPLVGSLRGSGRGYLVNAQQRAWWASIAAGPEILLPITSSFSWSLTGLGVLPLARQQFDVETSDAREQAFRSPAVAGQLTLGVRGEL